jgi:hypothetical protein
MFYASRGQDRRIVRSQGRNAKAVKPEEVEQKAVKMKSYAAHTHLIIMMLLPRARVPESDPQLMTNHPLSSRGFMARSRPSYYVQDCSCSNNH